MQRFFGIGGRPREAAAKIALLGIMLAFVGGLLLPGTAMADYGPQTYSGNGRNGDIVCVGSDTVQYIGNFLADGDFQGHAGFNASGATRQHDKLVSLDATGDAEARFSYAQTSTASTPQPLDPSVVLRQGQKPVQRPNGSGAGYNALVNDVTTTGRDEQINCARGSALPSSQQIAQAQSNGWGGLHVIRVATEPLAIAVNGQTTAGPTDAPANGLSVQQLQAIYTGAATTWGSIPGGYTGPCPSCAILPLLPQAGSGTRNKFLSDIGITAAQLGPNVNQQIEENDPTAITNASAPADAIVPFSGSRLNLWNNGYFQNPHVPCPPTCQVLTPNVHLLPTTGNASDGNPSYVDNRGLYFAWRASDDNGPAWSGNNQASANWVHVLFLGSSSFFGSSIKSKNGVTAAGATYAYLDCGINPTTC